MPYTKEGVKYFTSQMQGAPSVGSSAGQRIAALDACLINGFGLLSVTSLVVASEVATMTIGGGHQYKQWSVLLFAGVTGALSALNAQWKIKSVTGTTAVFDCPGVPDGTAAGSITAKVAPLGWAKPYTGTNLAVYKPTDAGANGFHLRVDDTAASGCQVRGFETMSAVSTGTGPFPTVAQQADPGRYWTWNASKPWIVWGDERMVYYSALVGPNTLSGVSGMFGDLVPEGVAPYSTIISGQPSDYSGNSTQNIQGDIGVSSTIQFAQGGYWLARDWHRIGGSVAVNIGGSFFNPPNNGGYKSGGVDMPMPYPHPLSGKMHISRAMCPNLGGIIMGVVPGLYHIHNRTTDVSNAFGLFEMITGLDGPMTGRTGMVIHTGNNADSGSNAYCRAIIDLVGPWR